MAAHYDEEDGFEPASQDFDTLQSSAIVPLANVLKKEKAKEEGVLLFDDIKAGMHVRMRCRCEAFVFKVNAGTYAEDRWLSVVYTKIHCHPGPKDLELFYAEGVSLKSFKATDVYHGDVFSSVFPVMEVPAPAWYPSLEKGPFTGGRKRMIRVRIRDVRVGSDVNLIIPGELSDLNAYTTASFLREAFKSVNAEVEVLPRSQENVESYLKIHAEGKPLPVERVNEIAFYEELVSSAIENPNEGSLEVSGTVPLPKESCVRVLEGVRKFPLWGERTVRLTLEDGAVISMNKDGKIS